MALNERLSSILLAVIREHIKTARAVGSETLAEHYPFGLSPASIRNALLELEEQDFLQQPHTSAGRVPTTKAYRYYIDHALQAGHVSARNQEVLRKAVQHSTGTPEERMKTIARTVAELCSNTVIIGFGPRDVYYTGLSHLFHQPEFAHVDHMLHLTEIVDRFDEVMAGLYHRVHGEAQVLLGRDNPFGDATSALFIRYHNGSHGHVFGILGPVRMAYEQNLAVLDFTKELLNA